MKKKISIILVMVMLISSIMLTGCSNSKNITIEYDKSVSLELISADNELNNVSVIDNVVKYQPTKSGDYEIKVKSSEGQEITITTIIDEDGCTVSDDSGLSFKTISE